MAERFDLEITFDYFSDKKYSSLLSDFEWARGSFARFTIKFVNKSGKIFPGAKFVAQANEAGLSWTYSSKVEVPALKPRASYLSNEFVFMPFFEGVCKIVLIAEDSDAVELWITGFHQNVPVKKQITMSFMVVNRQELEIISLLKQLVKNSKK